jgi:hypothetical protein
VHLLVKNFGDIKMHGATIKIKKTLNMKFDNPTPHMLHMHEQKIA